VNVGQLVMKWAAMGYELPAHPERHMGCAESLERVDFLGCRSQMANFRVRQGAFAGTWTRAAVMLSDELGRDIRNQK